MLKTLITSSALALSLSSFAMADAPMAFDVAEDHTRIFMENNPLHENGMPAHGNAFVNQGYIYPAGTLEADTAGVLKDGSPAFPDLVWARGPVTVTSWAKVQTRRRAYGSSAVRFLPLKMATQLSRKAWKSWIPVLKTYALLPAQPETKRITPALWRKHSWASAN